MNKVPQSERKHIAFIGRRNAGKSSLINAFAGQSLSIVSEVPGTTTDPVKKAIELLPYGPVVLVDTAGIDDVGDLGELRISRTMKIISDADFAIIVLDSTQRILKEEVELILYLEKLNTPYIIVLNKIELGVNPDLLLDLKDLNTIHYEVSAKENIGIDGLRKKVIHLLPTEEEPPLISDLVRQGDIIVLVVPIDLGAPKGRLILPQVQTIREALDEDTITVICKDKELRATLNSLKYPPSLVVTDSQVIMKVAADVPDNIPLTTFSILMARHKGDLPAFAAGLKRVEELQDGDKVLIAEACSHHAQEDDIGRVKIPRWLRQYSKKNLIIDIVSGHDYPEDLASYKLIVHCGGCTLTRRSMQMRIKQAKLMNVPIVNYGMIISLMHGAIPRALRPFEEVNHLF